MAQSQNARLRQADRQARDNKRLFFRDYDIRYAKAPAQHLRMVNQRIKNQRSRVNRHIAGIGIKDDSGEYIRLMEINVEHARAEQIKTVYLEWFLAEVKKIK